MITKVQLLRHSYDEARDYVFWDVKLPDGTTETMMCKRSNFGPTWTVPYTNIPIALIKDFLDKMIGQTINADIGGAGPVDPESLL